MRDSTLKDIDALITTFFAIFDNRSQRVSDFSRLEQLFLPDAIISKCGRGRRETMSLHDFVTPRAAMLSNGTLTDFHEWEIAADTFVNGATATHICKYGKEGYLDGKEFSGSGNKSFQMALTENGWHIISILWEDLEL